jgi:hypothetical protein
MQRAFNAADAKVQVHHTNDAFLVLPEAVGEAKELSRRAMGLGMGSGVVIASASGSPSLSNPSI